MVVRRRTNAPVILRIWEESGCKSPAVPVTVIPLGSGCSRRRSDDVPESLRLSRIASVLHAAAAFAAGVHRVWREGDPMGEVERNMLRDVGQSQGNAPSADSRRQMDMFEDERQRVSHRRGAIARGVAKRGLVHCLAFGDGLWHHTGSAVGRGRRGHCRGCGSGYDAE